MEKKFRHNNVNISYTTFGDGLTVVLLHGLPLDGAIWNKQIDFLKRHCRLIVPDIPGSGKSYFEKDTPEATTIEFYASCVHALLEHERVNDCIMLGHSMGGYITLAFAERYPEMLKGFGLIHSTAFADSAEKKQNRLRAIAMIEEYGSYAFIKNTTPNLFGSRFKTQHPEMINALIEKGQNLPNKVLQDYYRAMITRPDRTKVLKNSKVPVLFIMGTEDTAAPLGDVMTQVHLPRIAYVQILKQTGHMGMWESPEDMNRTLLNFIESFI